MYFWHVKYQCELRTNENENEREIDRLVWYNCTSTKWIKTDKMFGNGQIFRWHDKFFASNIISLIYHCNIFVSLFLAICLGMVIILSSVHFGLVMNGEKSICTYLMIRSAWDEVYLSFYDFSVRFLFHLISILGFD